MRRNLLIGLVLLAASWGTATGTTLTDARRCNGDPDEFQARQVLDEGIVLGRGALDAGIGGAGENCGEARKPAQSSRERAYHPAGRGRITVTLPGKHIFLER